MNAPGPTLVDVIDEALREKLPLKIDWDKLHRRAVAAAVAEHVVLWAELVPRSCELVTKPGDDLVAAINLVLRDRLPGTVNWTDERESDVVAYALAEQIQSAFEVKLRVPVQALEAVRPDAEGG